jgi:DNA-binding transcriptional regulator GbsR (MarR family)
MNIEHAARYFQAMGDPLRLTIILILLEHGDEMCLSEILDVCQADEKPVSLRLKSLRDANIVVHRDVAPGGHHKFYYQLINPMFVRGIIGLTEEAVKTAVITKELLDV